MYFFSSWSTIPHKKKHIFVVPYFHSLFYSYFPIDFCVCLLNLTSGLAILANQKDSLEEKVYLWRFGKPNLGISSFATNKKEANGTRQQICRSCHQGDSPRHTIAQLFCRGCCDQTQWQKRHLLSFHQ